MNSCICGSEQEYKECCGLYIEGFKLPKNPEALMRSRYSAYTKADIAYIKKTMRKKALLNFNEEEAYLWAKGVDWQGLEVINSYLDEQNKDIGFVEFKATFIERNKKQIIHELSQFEFQDNQWFYVEGSKPIKFKAARNALCLCNSQKKFKNCHGKV